MTTDDMFEDILIKKIEYAERQLNKIQKDLWWYKQTAMTKEKSKKQQRAISKIGEQLNLFGA